MNFYHQNPHDESSIAKCSAILEYSKGRGLIWSLCLTWWELDTVSTDLVPGCLALCQTLELGVTGGRKNKVTSYLKISLCRNGKLKGEILPHPLAYKPCLDLCCFKEWVKVPIVQLFMLENHTGCKRAVISCCVWGTCSRILHWLLWCDTSSVCSLRLGSGGIYLCNRKTGFFLFETLWGKRN